MGRWGMGLSSSDEFSEVKEWFFKDFYKGESIQNIEKNILNYFKKEYTMNGMMHDVYFALADCEWRCGFINKKILLKVQEIIINNENIYYLKELGATDSDLRKREKILNDFLLKISSINKKPITQKIKNVYMPKINTGDVFSYKVDDVYRYGIVLQAYTMIKDPLEWSSDVFEYLIVLSDLKANDQVSIDEVVASPIYSINWYMNRNLIKKKDMHIIGNIKERLLPDYSNYFGVKHDGFSASYLPGAWGNKETFIEDINSEETSINKNSKQWQLKMGLISKPIKCVFDEKNILTTKWRE